jgi:type IV secretory pathway protease TraF
MGQKLRAGRPIAALLAAAVALCAAAKAEIVVSPLRQVVTRQQPVAVYEISNVSNRIIDGRVGWMDLSAVETGYAPASPAARAALSAAPYLVVSPARFRLEPGNRTKITVQLKKGASIPTGERRSHLLVETTPVRTPLRRTGGGLEVDVGLGVSTPVILRSGLTAPAVSFTQTRLVRDTEGMLELQTTLSRTGNYSSFGRLEAVMTSEGKTRTIAEIDNVAVHVDAASRRLTLSLGEAVLPPGELLLTYVGEAEFDGRVFAEKKFEIAPPQ